MTSKKRVDFIYLFILIGAVALFHWRGLQPGYTFLPMDLANNNLPWLEGEKSSLQNWLISDPLYQFYPFLTTAVTRVQTFKQWPLWNPHIFTGHPSLGDPLSQPFYPWQLGMGLLFGPVRGFGIGLWSQVLLAALLTFGWLRTLSCTRVAALAGGLIYALSGYLVTWFETPFWVSTLSLLPGVLWMYELAIQTRRLRYGVLAALFMGGAFLGGQFQFMITFALFFWLYAIGRSIELYRQKRPFYGWPLLMAGLIGGTAVLLSAIFLLPAIELLSLSRRANPAGLSDPLPVVQLLTLFVPDFFGSPAAGTYWGYGNYSESTIYTGIVALVLAFAVTSYSRRFFIGYLLVVTAIFLYFIIGRPGVAKLALIPGLKYASLHRTSFILPLMAALFAATTLSSQITSIKPILRTSLLFAGIIGLAILFNIGDFQAHWSEQKNEIGAALALLFAVNILLWVYIQQPRLRFVAIGGVVFLIFLDLYRAGSHFNPVGLTSEIMPAIPIITLLQEKVRELSPQAPHRIMALQRNDSILFGPNVPSVFGLDEAGGYSSLVLTPYHQLISAADPKLDVWWMSRQANMVTFSFPPDRLVDLLQVSHVVSSVPLDLNTIQAEFIHDACEDITAITNKTTLQGQFLVAETAINRLDLRFAPQLDTAPQGNVAIRLWHGTQKDRLVLESLETGEDLARNPDRVYFFAPERYAPGQVYSWEISTENTQTGIGLCQSEPGQPAVSVYGPVWTEITQDNIYVYERGAPMPRAYVVYAAEHIPDEQKAIQLLLDDNFPVRNLAITTEFVDLPTKTSIPATPPTISTYDDTQVVMQVTAVQSGLLILGDQHYPGWQATINGHPTPILRVNQIYRGILLPPGTHEIIFSFKPVSLYIGILLSGVGIILFIIMLMMDGRFYKWQKAKKSRTAVTI